VSGFGDDESLCQARGDLRGVVEVRKMEHPDVTDCNDQEYTERTMI
jgi:hypothetical protein